MSFSSLPALQSEIGLEEASAKKWLGVLTLNLGHTHRHTSSLDCPFRCSDYFLIYIQAIFGDSKKPKLRKDCTKLIVSDKSASHFTPCQ